MPSVERGTEHLFPRYSTEQHRSSFDDLGSLFSEMPPYGGIIRNKAGLLVQTNLQIEALNTVLWDMRSHYMY